MKIWKYLSSEHIFLDHFFLDKDAILRFISSTLLETGVVRDAEQLYNSLKSRERMMSTGIGGGIGIPHAVADAHNAAVMLIRLDPPIEFYALDSLPVDIIIAIVVPENKTALHLQILAGISRLCRNPDFMKILRQSPDVSSVLENIRKTEEDIAFH